VGQALGWHRDLCRGSLLRNLVGPTLVESEVGVEKVVIGMSLLAAIIAAAEFFFSPQLSGSFHNVGFRLAEEPHQSLEVLGRRCEEELLPNKLHPT
jgi:hypothetical protein